MDEEKPLFQGFDELERSYAPEELPADDPEAKRARYEADDNPVNDPTDLEPPAAAPVASIGSSPSSVMAPPNIGHTEHGGAPGDPETDAGYPIGREEDIEEETR